MAGGGFVFLLLPFQYLVGWGFINMVISMNLFRFVYFENWSRCSLCAIRYVARVAHCVWMLSIWFYGFFLLGLVFYWRRAGLEVIRFL
jgi:hypothetical protein